MALYVPSARVALVLVYLEVRSQRYFLHPNICSDECELHRNQVHD